MTRFLGVLVIIVILVGVLGWYMDWFHFGSETTDGKTHISITVDQNKIKESENKVIEGVKQGVEKVRGTSSTTTTVPAKN